MRIKMNDSRLVNITQLKKFLKGVEKLDLSLRDADISEKYKFIDQTVDRINYRHLSKKDKRVVINYLKKFTGYKKTQLFKLIKRAKLGKLKRKKYNRKNPNRKYSAYDIKLLEKTDERHLRLNEKATQEILRREHEVFGKEKYGNIKKVSHAHVTNLREHVVYRNSWVNHTKSRQIPIGITMKPESFGKPGSIRVDTVHQKDIYHINAVDEITQWEIVICVPRITEEYMIPALEELLNQFPFIIFNFHSDRGSENINHLVSDLLNSLLIKQTKNRSYHCNDNALVETKNGSVIRKNMGWSFINKSSCDDINIYYKNYFNIYLNYHRPSGYPTIVINKKGRKKKIYNNYKVPYEFLKDLSNSKEFLKPGLSFTKLDRIAYQMSDNDFAKILRKKERLLFNKIEKYNKNRS